jgi:hypothetical protein
MYKHKRELCDVRSIKIILYCKECESWEVNKR